MTTSIGASAAFRNASMFLVTALGACTPPPAPPLMHTPAPAAASEVPISAPAQPPMEQLPRLEASIFAEGWSVDVAATRGPVVVYDRLLGAMVTVEGERIAHVDAPFVGLPAGPGVVGSITGGWPEGALMTLRSAGNNWVLKFFRRTRGAWEMQHLGAPYVEDPWIRDPADDAPGIGAQVARGAEGRSLLLIIPHRAQEYVYSLGGAGKPGTVGDPLTTSFDSIDATASGGIAVLGSKRSRALSEDQIVVELRTPGRAPESVKVGDRQDVERFSLRLCLSPRGAMHVLRHERTTGKAALLTLRGSLWDTEEIPGTYEGGPLTCAVAPDDTVWMALARNVIGRRSPSSTIERFAYPELPARTRRQLLEAVSPTSRRLHLLSEEIPADQRVPDTFVPREIFAADDGSVWIRGARAAEDSAQNELGAYRSVLLRVGPPLPGAPVDWDALTGSVIQSRIATFNIKGTPSLLWHHIQDRFSETCSEPFVRIRMPGRRAVSDSDIEATRAVIKGHAELAGVRYTEAWLRDEPIVAALVPTVAVGKRLVGLVQGQLRGADPKLFCGEPHLVRLLPLGEQAP